MNKFSYHTTHTISLDVKCSNSQSKYFKGKLNVNLIFFGELWLLCVLTSSSLFLWPEFSSSNWHILLLRQQILREK